MFRKVNLLILTTAGFLFNFHAFSGEITDTEWNVLNQLVITYYSGTSSKVECTVFNNQNKPIGGGFGFASGGVARVSVSVPKKYKNAKLTANCKP